MRKNRNRLLIGLAMITTLIILSGTVLAYTEEDAFWIGGFPSSVIASTDYWEDSGVSSLGYSNWASNARSDWAGIADSDVSYYRTTSSSSADLRIYAGNYGDDYAGICKGYEYDGTYDSDCNDEWYKCQVLLNDHYMDDWSYSNANRHKTTIHELGHALSLCHQPSYESSVMRQGKLTYTDPTTLDEDNIAWKY